MGRIHVEEFEMGLGGIGIWQMIIVLIIVLLLFGTKKLKNIGGDLGGAIKSFKKAVKDKDGAEETADAAEDKVEELTDAAKEAVEDVAEKVDTKSA